MCRSVGGSSRLPANGSSSSECERQKQERETLRIDPFLYRHWKIVRHKSSQTVNEVIFLQTILYDSTPSCAVLRFLRPVRLRTGNCCKRRENETCWDVVPFTSGARTECKSHRNELTTPFINILRRRFRYHEIDSTPYLAASTPSQRNVNDAVDSKRSWCKGLQRVFFWKSVVKQNQSPARLTIWWAFW